MPRSRVTGTGGATQKQEPGVLRRIYRAMLVLHALWCGDVAPPCMRLWAESGVELQAAPTPRRGGARKIRPHPFAVSTDALRAILEPLLGTSLDDTSQTTIWLPSSGAPVPSDPLIEGDAPSDAQLAPWSVPVLDLGPAHAAVALAELPARPEGFVLGADAVAWSAAGRWVLGLLARERAVPVIDDAGARWMAVLDDPQDQVRLKAVAAALPPSGRSYRDGAVPTGRAAVIDFAQRAVDDYLGGVMADLTARPRIPERWPEEARAWADTLARGEVSLPRRLGPNTLRRFQTEIARWTAPVRGSGGAPPSFRTCFRLAPPAASRRGKSRDWDVEILLQAADDPSLLRSPSDAWTRKDSTSERFLGDLGRAVRVFPTLSRALAERQPSHLALKVEEASQFLRETAWLLEESGFGVFVPSDRLIGGDAIRLKLRVRQKKEGTVGKRVLGLEAIVGYDWEVSLGEQTLDADEFRALAAQKVPLVEVRGQWVLLDPEQVDRTLRAFEREGPEMTLGEALQWTTREGLPPVELALEGVLAALAEPARLEELEMPGSFHGELRPYQRRGFSWLAFLAARGLGACLADDMGLGKTIQVITLLLHLGRPRRPALLVCPTSLVGNWQREVARFGPSLRVGVHHGTDRRKKAAFPRWAADWDVVLTTYALAARDEEVLATVEWDGIILDEAQNVKNPDARQSRAVRALKGRWRVAMSGTPVENRLTDLWSIMDFLNPGLLGPRATFRRQFVHPVERFGDARRAAQLRSAVGPFVLRRLKTDRAVIADLPEKQEMKVYCPLTREQATLYQATVDDMLRKIEESDGIQRRGLVLSTMLRLKQICDHPALFLADGSSPQAGRSGKQQRLEEMLEELIEAGDSALIFTQFASFGKELAPHLAERLSRRVLFLSGETPRAERDAIVARFQAEGGPPVFVLSLKAGGVGLNLTRASHVFHFDRWWNPAVENQATDRAFRIGQRRNVQVHKFICQGTLEEAIDALIESKLALAEQVVGSGESWLTELDTKQLRRLFTLQAGAIEEDVP